MSPLLRRLGATLRRRRDDDATEALRHVDLALRNAGARHLGRAPGSIADDVVTVLLQRRDYAEQVDRIDTLLRDRDHRLTDDVADDVARALTQLHARTDSLAHATRELDRAQWAEAERDAAHEALSKVAAAAGRPGAPTRWNVEDLVEWASEARGYRTRHKRLVRQSETFEAELIAVDEALAKAGADPADDRVDALRALVADAPVRLPARDDGADQDPTPAEKAEVLRCMQLADDPGPVLAYRVGRLGPLAWTPTRVYGSSRGTGTPTIAMPRTWSSSDPDPWCSADLDGARCARPAGHTEPCRPVEDRPVLQTARCCATKAPRGGRCRSVAGHHGEHDWEWQW